MTQEMQTLKQNLAEQYNRHKWAIERDEKAALEQARTDIDPSEVRRIRQESKAHYMRT